MRGGAPLLVAGAAAVGLLPALVVRQPTLRVALETLIIACLGRAAMLAWTFGAASRRRRDLALLAAIAALLTWQAVAFAVPAALVVGASSSLSEFAAWGALAVGLALLSCTIFPVRSLARGPRSAFYALLVGGGIVLLGCGLGLLSLLLGTVAPGSLVRTTPFVSALFALAAGVLIAAAVSVLRSARLLRGDGAMLLGVGFAALAISDFDSAFLRQLGTAWVSVPDLLRLLAAAAMLASLERRDRVRRGRVARAAALAERQRIAQDLHDGLAQDLAFIAAHGVRLAEAQAARAGESVAIVEHPVVLAARRALAVTRGVIDDLTDPAGASLADGLAATAAELSDRFDMTIMVEASDELRVSEGCRRDLLRIVREAIANAARHGEAGRVVISVARSSSGLELSVIDDGRGLSDRVGRVAAEGFGIASMRDRAAVLGGQLTIHRPAGGGTELVVRIP